MTFPKAIPSCKSVVPSTQIFTANGNYTVPANATVLDITAVGGGGGGGGGGSALTAGGVATQTGGGGGGAGPSIRQIVSVVAGNILAVTIGAGGAGGAGGAINGNPGGIAAMGADSTVIGPGVNITSSNGGPGRSGAGNDVSQRNGGYPGIISNYNAEAVWPGGGGASLVTPARPGACGNGFMSGGGGGGGVASATNGGGGGAGGNYIGANGGGTGTSATANGVNGGNGAANTGAGGGGGGGGAPGGAGGAGGNGGSGYVIITVVG